MLNAIKKYRLEQKNNDLPPRSLEHVTPANLNQFLGGTQSLFFPFLEKLNKIRRTITTYSLFFYVFSSH